MEDRKEGRRVLMEKRVKRRGLIKRLLFKSDGSTESNTQSLNRIFHPLRFDYIFWRSSSPISSDFVCDDERVYPLLFFPFERKKSLFSEIRFLTRRIDEFYRGEIGEEKEREEKEKSVTKIWMGRLTLSRFIKRFEIRGESEYRKRANTWKFAAKKR